MGLSPEDSQHVVDSVALSWPYVGLALLGGLARACRFGVHSVKQFIGGLLCSGVSGLLCILALSLHYTIKMCLHFLRGLSLGWSDIPAVPCLMRS